MASPPPSVPVASPASPAPTPSWGARLRQAHGWLAPVVLTPLLLSALTGVGYRLLRDWGGLSRDQTHVLMVLHEGEWLKPWVGPAGETLYVLLNGLGLLWMLVTGGAMAWERLRRSWRRRGGRGVT
ncbi:peptidase [Synechococcus sp. CCY 9618]|uniref:peptidase n=1 Tax=Synechococcus sp. CCY 9618 TaxID=2815602 RepID=UPI0020B41C7E|nr:peptidase [Synechococcus sp. CCY 9618]